jgi:hypothetical protein
VSRGLVERQPNSINSLEIPTIYLFPHRLVLAWMPCRDKFSQMLRPRGRGEGELGGSAPPTITIKWMREHGRNLPALFDRIRIAVDRTQSTRS